MQDRGTSLSIRVSSGRHMPQCWSPQMRRPVQVRRLCPCRRTSKRPAVAENRPSLSVDNYTAPCFTSPSTPRSESSSRLACLSRTRGTLPPHISAVDRLLRVATLAGERRLLSVDNHTTLSREEPDILPLEPNCLCEARLLGSEGGKWALRGRNHSGCCEHSAATAMRWNSCCEASSRRCAVTLADW
jgi:hypothetical protein